MLSRLAILAVILSVVQTSVPVPRKASSPKTDTRHNEAAKTNGDHEPASNATPMGPQQGHAPALESQTDTKNAKDGWDKAGILANYFLVAIGAGGIVVAICTLRNLERQTKATQDAATAAIRATDIAANDMKVSSRAWVSARVKHHLIEVGKPVTVAMEFCNLGDTPALKVNNCLVVDVVEGNGFNPVVTYPADNVARGPHVLMPKDSSVRRMELSANRDFVEPLFLTLLPEGEHKLNSREYTLVAFGMVEYDDVFGEHHWTKYCMRLVPNIGWGMCDEGNNVDMQRGDQPQKPN